MPSSFQKKFSDKKWKYCLAFWYSSLLHAWCRSKQRISLLRGKWKRVHQIFWRGNKFVNIKLKSASKEKERENTNTFADSAAQYNVRISRKLKLKVPSYRSKGWLLESLLVQYRLGEVKDVTETRKTVNENWKSWKYRIILKIFPTSNYHKVDRYLVPIVFGRT